MTETIPELDWGGWDALQRRRALERSDSQAHFQTHSGSKTVAKPWPTPTQSDAMPHMFFCRAAHSVGIRRS
jgi:hypothetical protein